MLETCTLMYPVLNHQQKTAKKAHAQQRLQIPITYKKILQFFEADYLKTTKTRSKNSNQGVKSDIKPLSYLLRDAFLSMKLRGIYSSGLDRKYIVTDTIIEVLYCGSRTLDKHCQLAYAVTVNHSGRRVTLALHGSADDMGWTNTMNSRMRTVMNPMSKHPGQEEDISIHETFHTCLFQQSSRGAKGVHGEDLTEYQDILLQMLPILQKYPGYKLYGELSQMHLLILL